MTPGLMSLELVAILSVDLYINKLKLLTSLSCFLLFVRVYVCVWDTVWLVLVLHAIVMFQLFLLQLNFSH